MRSKWIVLGVVASLWACDAPPSKPAGGEPAKNEPGGFEPVGVTGGGGEVGYELDPAREYVDPIYDAPAWSAPAAGALWDAAAVGAALDAAGGCALPVDPEAEREACAPAEALAKARFAEGAEAAALARLTHPRAAARAAAARALGQARGLDAGAVDAIVDRARVEGHPVVLTAIVEAVRGKFAISPRARDVLLAHARASDERVRMAVVEGLASQIYLGDQPTLTAALEMIEQDPSDEVRGAGCAALGQRAGKDARALAWLEEVTAKPEVDPPIFAPCWVGLVNAFAAPALRAPSDKAYTLVVERLDRTPRVPGNPPYQALQRLASLNALGSLPGFVEKMGVRELARAVALDDAPDPNTRAAAIDVFVAFGATKSDLEALRAEGFDGVVPSAKGPEAYVLRRLEEATRRAAP